MKNKVIDAATMRVMNTSRNGVRTTIFTEEARINGPEFYYRAPDCKPGPAIQMGSVRTKTSEDEFNLCSWYVNNRLPAMAKMPGCINTRKLVSVAGWAKHSAMYEFLSLEARNENFMDHEALGLDESSWSSNIIKYTLHAPGSPSVGRRMSPTEE